MPGIIAGAAFRQLGGVIAMLFQMNATPTELRAVGIRCSRGPVALFIVTHFFVVISSMTKISSANAGVANAPISTTATRYFFIGHSLVEALCLESIVTFQKSGLGQNPIVLNALLLIRKRP